MITGPSGNYIFLPAVGQRYGTNIGSQKNFGYYWSGTLYSTGYSNYLSFSNTQYQLTFAILDVLSVPFQSDQHLKQNSKLICKELNNH